MGRAATHGHGARTPAVKRASRRLSAGRVHTYPMMAPKKVGARAAKPRLSASGQIALPAAAAARDSAKNDAPARGGGARKKGNVGKQRRGGGGEASAGRRETRPRACESHHVASAFQEAAERASAPKLRSAYDVCQRTRTARSGGVGVARGREGGTHRLPATPQKRCPRWCPSAPAGPSAQ